MSVTKLILIFLAIVNHVSSTCVHVPNNDMIEYACENGSPYDIYSIPERTEKIQIRNVALERITSDTFSRFGDNLWVLACSHCQIAEITSDAFKQLKNLQQLRLDNNHLRTVKASWFEGLSYLTYLDLNYNQIETIENGVFDNLPGLVDLRIAGNKIECLNVDEMSRLNDLKRIFLNQNPHLKCPNAISEILREKDIDFERDFEWEQIKEDLIKPTSSLNHNDWRTSTYSSTPMYRERLILSHPVETTTEIYSSNSKYLPPSQDNSPTTIDYTSASYPSYEVSTQVTHEWPIHESYTTRPTINEPYYQTNNFPAIVTESRSNEYVSPIPTSQDLYNEPYYPSQPSRTSYDPYKDTLPVVVPTTTAKIFWSNSDEVFNETDNPPIETIPPSYAESPVYAEPPIYGEPSDGSPLHEEFDDYQNSRPPIQQEYPQSHPLENYQQVDEKPPVTIFSTVVTTTDKPLPNCNSSTSSGISALIIFLNIFYYLTRIF